MELPFVFQMTAQITIDAVRTQQGHDGTSTLPASPLCPTMLPGRRKRPEIQLV